MLSFFHAVIFASSFMLAIYCRHHFHCRYFARSLFHYSYHNILSAYKVSFASFILLYAFITLHFHFVIIRRHYVTILCRFSLLLSSHHYARYVSYFIIFHSLVDTALTGMLPLPYSSLMLIISLHVVLLIISITPLITPPG